MPNRSFSPNFLRYAQFFLLVLAGGVLYPLIYLRQNFETSLLEVLAITSTELGELYSLLGIIYTVTYMPSGQLADRCSPRLLITFSLAAVGGLGLCLSCFPALPYLKLIFVGFGLAAGLTFWAALIKSVKLLAAASEQGRFFGILDGGRGLVGALLASVAVAMFSYLSHGQERSLSSSLRWVILMYAGCCLLTAVLVFVFLDHKLDHKHGEHKPEPKFANKPSLPSPLPWWPRIKSLLALPQLWLMALIIFSGYQLFWATYSFSAYLQEGYQLTAMHASYITAAKLWMRPLGGIAAGFLGDRFSKSLILMLCFLFASLALLALIGFSPRHQPLLGLGIVLTLGLLTYAIRGLYWSLLDSCQIPAASLGLAIGIISFLGYLPDIALPLLNNAIAANFPSLTTYHLYFSYIATCGFIGVGLLASFHKKSLSKHPQKMQEIL